jgi:hypothetical protein
MTISEDRMGSDHHPIVIELKNLTPNHTQGVLSRSAWRTDKIPHYKSHKFPKIVSAFADSFKCWTADTKSQVEELQENSEDNAVIADILEHSFQNHLDEITNKLLGSRTVGPPPTPRMHSAISILNSQRKACEKTLRRVMSNPSSPEFERAMAVRNYRMAKARVLRAGAARKELREFNTFIDIEDNQADSKLFWSKANSLMSGLRRSISPSPMVEVGHIQSQKHF